MAARCQDCRNLRNASVAPPGLLLCDACQIVKDELDQWSASQRVAGYYAENPNLTVDEVLALEAKRENKLAKKKAKPSERLKRLSKAYAKKLTQDHEDRLLRLRRRALRRELRALGRSRRLRSAKRPVLDAEP